MTTLTCEFHYDSAHRLPKVPEGHKCGQLHGHTYRLIAGITGPVREDGFVVDFAEVKRLFDPLVSQLDHHYLNEVEGLDNPTVEIQLRWFADRLPQIGFWVSKLTIFEGLTNSASLEL